MEVLCPTAWIKSENRRPAPHGPAIIPISVTASSSSTNNPADNLIRSNGKSDIDNDKLIELTTDPVDMWLTEKGDTTGSVELQLPEPAKVGLIQIYNYNELGRTNRGVKSADISLWTETAGWEKVFDDFQFASAQNCDDYDEPVILYLDGKEANKIKFDDIRNHGDKEYVGLGKIEVYQLRGTKAFEPIPAVGLTFGGPSDITLEWTPGFGAEKHILSIGNSPENLNITETFKNCGAIANGLKRNTKYYWRIDEVQIDGTVVQGDLWDFELTGSCLGHWPLDEEDGLTASDLTGKRNGTVSGTPSWKPGMGKFGGCIELNGTDNDIKIPPLNITTNNIALTAWVNVEAPKSLAAILFHRLDSSSVCGLNFYFNNEIRHHWEPPGGWNLPTQLMVPYNQWTFVAATIDSENTTLYMHDGKKLSTNTIKFPHPPLTLSESFYIGRDTNAADRTLKGMVDDVRIYDYSLSEDQIRQIIENKTFDKEASSITLAEAPEKIIAQAKIKAVSGKSIDVTRLDEPQQKKFILIMITVIIAVFLFFIVMAKRPKA